MNRGVMKLLLVAGALLLGACSSDRDVTGPAPESVRIDVRYDVQVQSPQNQPLRQNRVNRYAMAAS